MSRDAYIHQSNDKDLYVSYIKVHVHVVLDTSSPTLWDYVLLSVAS